MKKLFLIIILLLNSCAKDSPEQITPVIVGIPNDIESLNPLFSFTGYETVLTELLYPALVQYEWTSEGNFEFFPMLAERWVWNGDSTSITFYLRKDVNWRDGRNVTVNDIIFSFDLYSDPFIQSRLFGTFDHFILDKDLHINIEKTFQSTDPHILKVNFSEGAVPDLKYFDMPMIPEHVFGKFERSDFSSLEKGLDSVTCGAFYLSSWDKNQSIIFKRDKQPFIEDDGNISEIIFKVVPDYNSRLMQLRRGEIDFMEDIKTEDVSQLKSANLIVKEIEGKEYDYAGWNNILPGSDINSGAILSHPLFGSSEIRKALTLAINREEIFEEFLQSYGSLGVGPVSPIFSKYFNNDLLPLEFNPGKAKEILRRNGWKDEDHNGIMEKEGKEFSFKFNIPSGNPRREYAASIIKNNLRAVGINISVEQLEPGVFFDKMFSRELDAWLAGWVIPVPLDLAPFWHSDLKNAQLNVAGYRNEKADSLLNLINDEKNDDKKSEYIKSFQEIIYNDQPVTFMYWIDNLAAYSNRIENIKMTPLGPFHHCWNWSLK